MMSREGQFHEDSTQKLEPTDVILITMYYKWLGNPNRLSLRYCGHRLYQTTVSNLDADNGTGHNFFTLSALTLSLIVDILYG